MTCLLCGEPLTDIQRLSELVRVLTEAMRSSPDTSTRFLDAREAADLLGFTVEALYARVERGDMDDVVSRVGRRTLRFASDGLVRWALQGRARRRGQPRGEGR